MAYVYPNTGIGEEEVSLTLSMKAMVSVMCDAYFINYESQHTIRMYILTQVMAKRKCC